ncbi:M48 family metallopeptidase [Hyphomonadaceae bacterium ML37]|nr:M48 family metallopeptidase [Hyphomonadaceae bacterium ML37]
MIAAAGLRTHIWNNNLKSIVLMAGFPVLLLALTYAGALFFVAYSADAPGQQEFALALDWTLSAIPFVLVAAGVWFIIAWLGYQRMIDAATGAHTVRRTDEPKLYNLLENLCISRGLTMPALRIIETPSLNAYATGLSERQAAVTVTRGLMDSLDDDELEAVLAHELTHIRNRDVRLLVISVIFVGIISFVGQIFARGMLRGSVARAGGARRGGGGNAGVLIIVALAIVALSYVLAIMIRFAMSRKREYMADAGAVELTRNPDAMIGALNKISGRTTIDKAPEEVRQMFLHDDSASFAGLFTTHPPIPKRIAALEAYAGGSSVRAGA